MIKKTSLIALLFSVIISASAQYANTRLWRISGNGLTRPSYLFGSMHVDDERVFNFSDSLFYALSSCDVFANEVSNDEMLSYMYKIIDDKIQEKIEDAYFGDDDDALNELSLNTGLDKSSLKKLGPVVLKQMVRGTAGTKNHKPAVLDFYLYDIARHEGKICTGIESLQTQTALFNKYPDYLKKSYTDYTIGKKRNSQNSAMIDVYSKADLNAVETLINTMPADLKKALFADRNEGMAHHIDSISRLKSAFYTMGIGHLPGKEGLISLLTNMGYKIEPVAETFTGMADRFPFAGKEFPWVTFSDSKSGYTIDLPGQWYTSPNFPSGIAHCLFYDMGSNSFYMAVARSSSVFRTEINLDSLVGTFTQNAWKLKLPEEKIYRVDVDGHTFDQVDKLKFGDYYISIRMGIIDGTLYTMAALNNQEKEMKDISRFFNSFRLTGKIAENWNTFRSEKGGYSVSFPGNPKENILTKNEEQTKEMTVGVISGIDNTSGNEFLVQYVDHHKQYYPDDTLMLSLILKNTTSTQKYTVVHSEKANFEGFPALKYSYKIESGQTIRVEAIIRGTRVYTLICSELNIQKDSALSALFFNSFTFNNSGWNNWENQTSAQGNFSAFAPALFHETPDKPGEKFITNTESFYSFDEFTGDKLKVTKNVFSPYYQSDCDSSFFKKHYSDLSDSDDSITEQTHTSIAPISYAFTSVSPKNHLVTKIKFILKGRSLYSLIAKYPQLYSTSHPARKSIETFTVTDTTSGNLAENKTLKLLAALSSNDTAISYAAKAALFFYDFRKDEFPLVWESLRHPFNDDTLKYNSTRMLLINSMGPDLDSVYKNKLIASYDTICVTNAAKLEALLWLTDRFDIRYRDFVKKQLLLIPANVIDKYELIQLFSDSAEYSQAMFPEILDMLSDTLNRAEVINLANSFLLDNYLSIKILEPYKNNIVELANNLLLNPEQLDPDDFYTPKIFLIAGYFNDPKINAQLEKNRDPKNIFIAYNILKALINNNLKLKQKNIARIAENVDLRRSFYDFLLKKGLITLMPEKNRTQASIAESDFYRYMVSEDYYPEKITLMGSRDIIYNDTLQRFFLFSFETGSADDPTVISIAGPYPTDNSMPESDYTVLGNYWSENSLTTVDEHFSAFIESLKVDESE